MCLVLAVLAGLLGMHGPAAAPAFAAPASSHSHERQAGPPVSADGDCHDPCEGHETHAVTDCAAASVGAGPAPSPPSPAPYATGGATAAASAGAAPPAPEGGRGPPSLSQLQLLRI